MTFGGAQKIVRIAFMLSAGVVALLLASPGVLAQTANGALRGQVTDPSGSTIANATVIVTTSTGGAITAATNRDGIYELKNLAPGKYDVKVISEGFAAFETSNVEILSGQTQKLDVPLTIEVREEKVTVTDQAAAALDTNPANNAGAICRLSLALPPAQMAARSTLTASPAASFHPKPLSEKFASTRIHFPRNTTSSAMDASKS